MSPVRAASARAGLVDFGVATTVTLTDAGLDGGSCPLLSSGLGDSFATVAGTLVTNAKWLIAQAMYRIGRSATNSLVRSPVPDAEGASTDERANVPLATTSYSVGT